MLENETQQKEKLEGEIATLHTQLLQLSLTADEVKRNLPHNFFFVILCINYSEGVLFLTHSLYIRGRPDETWRNMVQRKLQVV